MLANEDPSIQLQPTVSYFQTLKHWIKLFFSSQLFGHLIMLTVLNLYGGFSILSTYSLKNMNPVVFATLRAMITAITLIPVCLIVDRNYSFSKHKSNAASKQGQQIEEPIYSFRSHASHYWTQFWNKFPTQKQFKQLCSCGIFLMLNQIFYTTGMYLTSPVIAAVFQPAVAVFTCLFSVLLKREKSSVWKFLGVVVAAVGAVSMLLINTLTSNTTTSTSSNNNTNNNNEWIYGVAGTLCFIANTFSYSFYLITQKTLLDKGIPPITITTYSFCTECVFLAFLGAFFLPFFHPKKVSPMGWFGLFYAGIAQGSVSFTLGTYAARLLSPAVISVYSCVNPVIAAVYTFIFLGKLSSPWVLIGVVLITLGVFLVSFARYRENKKAWSEQAAKVIIITTEESKEELEIIQK